MEVQVKDGQTLADMGVCQNRHILFFDETLNPFCKNGQPFLKKQSTVLMKTIDPFCGQSKF